MKRLRWQDAHRAVAIAGTLWLAMGWAWGYSQYSTNRADNCAACHGDFRASPYTEMAPGGQTWAADLMTVHLNMVSSCLTCHSSGPRFPVLTNSSAGGTGLSPLSCAGCHGRPADGTGTGTVRYGAGLRQHHWRAAPSHPTMDLQVCGTCHADANPANYQAVGESSMPTYYTEEIANNHVANPGLPADPCNMTPPLEDVDGTPDGLDNDGDLDYDVNDPDCSPGPGETSSNTMAPLLVTSVNPGAGTLAISYQGGCLATNQTLVYGPLSQVRTYGYSGQSCAIGNTGSFTWTYPAGSLFFLVVGNDGIREGSYGTKRNAGVVTERPPYTTAVACPLPQDLVNRCD